MIGFVMKVRGISQKGNTRIHDHGNIWVVRQFKSHVQFTIGARGANWALIDPIDDETKRHSRWVNIAMDNDFEIVRYARERNDVEDE